MSLATAKDKSVTTTAQMLKDDPSLVPGFLRELKDEREKVCDANKAVMQMMVDILVEAGVYPPLNEYLTGPDCKLTHLKMVEAYGEDWHVFKGLQKCPHCNASLCSDMGPPFKREMGVEIFGLYDGVAYYQCPDCKGAMSRKGNPLTPEEVKNLSRDEIFFK